MPFSLAIALAWPDTYCKQTGAWYDKPANWLGIANNSYYKVGHSAVILVEPKTHECLYFDFGRYHAPFGYGRVRDAITDHELIIHTKAEVDKNLRLKNYQQIIDEVQSNRACHGDGQLFAGLVRVDFEKAYQTAKRYQAKGAIYYGPFTFNGTNCSRFVRSLLYNSVLSLKLKLKLTFPWTITPTPIGVVKNLNYQKRANFEKNERHHQDHIKSCEIQTY
jgi:hypothetical protein